jgi:ADP-ribose pyrophosphatase YjhB (NUDIX family)
MPGLETKNMDASDAEKQFLRNKLDSQHAFDGVLPRLVGWRTERDNGNGRLRLHLAMAETTYGAVLLDHYPDALGGTVRNVTGMRAKLLTLSAIVVSSDRKLLFAGRSRHAGSHPDKFGPAVNGNLELRPRKGILPDGDEFGLPDPRRALAREAAEELGLVMDPHRIQMLGMGRFSVGDKERGTHVLLALAQPDLTAEDITAGIRDADPMEGRWELGSEFLAAPLPRAGEDVDPILSWLLHDPRLTPHAVLTGIAAVARFFPITPEQLHRLSAAPRDPGFSPESLQLDY